jgi:hypothetical protein
MYQPNRAHGLLAPITVVAIQIVLSGCVAMSQDPKTVLIREPGNRTYNPAVSISESAKELWEAQ